MESQVFLVQVFSEWLKDSGAWVVCQICLFIISITNECFPFQPYGSVAYFFVSSKENATIRYDTIRYGWNAWENGLKAHLHDAIFAYD